MQGLLVCKQKELQGVMLYTPARLHFRQQKRQEAGYIQVSDHELNKRNYERNNDTENRSRAKH